tara:strand:- start:186 stop:464 length:279 start_codon:yes stop_codon:yes gene_type:complete
MSKAKLSHMQTKGWHYDVTDNQIEQAQKAIRALIGILESVYYTESPDPFSAKRYFWTPEKGNPKNPIELACFDHYGNLVIYSASLTTENHWR